MGFCQRLYLLVAQEGDDADCTHRKRIAIWFAPILWVVATAFAVSTYTQGRHNNAYYCFLAGTSVEFGFVTIWLFCTRSMSLELVERLLVLCTAVTLLFGDWATAAMPGAVRSWPLVVPILDVLISVRARRVALYIVVHGTAVWLLVTSIEDAYRLGVYDVQGWTEQDPDVVEQETNCAEPPCAAGLFGGINRASLFIVCLYIDFFATRGFAEGQRREQERVELMVRVAEQVAACLVRFDLASAQQSLDEAGAGGLSPELGGSFRSLLANLASYRPYLPQSCFEEPAEERSDSSASGRDPSRQGTDGTGSRSARPGHTSDTTSVVQSLASFASPKDAAIARQSEDAGQSDLRQHSHNVASCRADGLAATSSCQSLQVPRQGHAAQQKRVSLLATNRSGLLDALTQVGQVSLGAWLAQAVGRFCAAVLLQKGLVDSMSADHLHASFGALRNLGAHRMAAVRCAADWAGFAGTPQRDAGINTPRHTDADAILLDQLQSTSAICTGAAVCGDFGSAAARSFMVVGAVAAFARVAERVAAGWGSPVLIDGEVHSDAQLSWDCALRGVVSSPKFGERDIQFWEVCAESKAGRSSQTEWMYELGARRPNPWETYSAAVMRWCKGEVGEALALVSGALDEGADAEPDEDEHDQAAEGRAAEDLRLLCAALRAAAAECGAAAPTCTVPTAAGVCAPAPLRQCAQQQRLQHGVRRVSTMCSSTISSELPAAQSSAPAVVPL